MSISKYPFVKSPFAELRPHFDLKVVKLGQKSVLLILRHTFRIPKSSLTPCYSKWWKCPPSTTKHFAVGKIQILLYENVSGCIFKGPSVSHFTVGQTRKKFRRKNITCICRIVLFRRHEFAYYKNCSELATLMYHY